MASETKHSHQLALQRGQRLRQLRKLARLTLKQMGSDGQINPNTLAAWESALYAGLTQKGAIKVINRLKKEGIICDIEWLMHGNGNPPETLSVFQITDSVSNDKPDTICIENEIKLFETLHPNFIGMTLQDNHMAPNYKKGDYIAGVALPKDKLTLAAGKPVIAKLKENCLLCRHLIVDELDDSVALVASNLSQANPAIIYTTATIEISLILYHLTQDNFKIINA